MPQLAEDEAAFGVDGIGDLLPGGHLVGGVDAWHVVEAIGGVGDQGGFGDEQRAGRRGALGVVGYHHFGGDVSVGGAVARHGRHGDAVLEEEISQLEGREEP